MTSIGVIHATVSATVSTTGTTFAEVVESDALTDGTTYYVVCHAIVDANSSALTFEWRLVDRTNSDAVLSNSTLIREPAQNGVEQSYYFVGRFTAGSDGGGLAFEQRSATDVSKIARTQYASMMIFDLSNMQSNDFFFDNDRTNTALSATTFADFAAGSITAPQDGEIWMVWGWQASAMNNVDKSVEMQLNYDNGTSETNTPSIKFEGEDLTEVLGFSMSQPFTIADTPATATWTMLSRDSGVSAVAQNNHLESTVFGVRLNAFKDFTSTFTEAETTSTSTDWVELKSSSFTPTHAGDVIVSAYSTANLDGSTRKSFQRVQVDGTTSPNVRPDTQYSSNANDASDELALGYITKYTGVAGTAATLDYDVKKNIANDVGWGQFSLVAFTIELEEAFNFSAVALDTYNSGDRASETFAAGDVAAEVNPE